MKAFLLITLCALTLHAQNPNQTSLIEHGRLVSGSVVNGFTKAYDKLNTNDGERIYIVNLSLLTFPIKQALKLYHNSPDGIPTTWLFDKKDVVHIGHQSLARRTILFPSWAYGVDYACDVTGALIIDGDAGKITTHKDGVKFVYEDPYTKKKTTDILTLVAEFDPASTRAGRRYSFTCVVKDTPDSIFCSYLFGTFTQTQTNIHAEEGVAYEGNYMQYQIYAEDTTKPQVINYVNWWINCVLPSL